MREYFNNLKVEKAFLIFAIKSRSHKNNDQWIQFHKIFKFLSISKYHRQYQKKFHFTSQTEN